MEINVSQQLKMPIGTLREYDICDELDISGTGTKNLLKGAVALTRTNRGILVQGKLNTLVSIECSRCLNSFDYPLNINIEEEYFPVIDINSGSALEIPDEPDSFKIDEHHILDLREAVRQNGLLAIPMKPLCRKDCPGICPDCGKDLTKGNCSCDKKKIDSRWLKLIEPDSSDKNKNNKSKKETE
jgi:uncharacterized protein